MRYVHSTARRSVPHLRAGLVGLILLVSAACGERSARSEGGVPESDTTRVAAPAATEKALVAAIDANNREAMARLPPGAGRELILGNCLICHGAGMIVQQHKDAQAWQKTITQMRGWGAPLPSEEEATLVAYLAEHFSPWHPRDNPSRFKL